MKRIKKFFYLLLSFQHLNTKKILSDIDLGIGVYGHITIEDFFPESDLGNVFLEIGYMSFYHINSFIPGSIKNFLNKNNDLSNFTRIEVLIKIGYKIHFYSILTDYICLNLNYSFKSEKIPSLLPENLERRDILKNRLKNLDENAIDLEVNICKKIKAVYMFLGVNISCSKDYFDDFSVEMFKKHIFYMAGIRYGYLGFNVCMSSIVLTILSFVSIGASAMILKGIGKVIGLDLLLEGKKYKITSSNMKFKDVCVPKDLQISLQEIVDYMKDNKKYIKIGAQLPRGMLIYGPPGTGKTLVANALSGEIKNCSFASISSADFMGDTGIKQLQEIFREARSKSAAVIFIDELEILGDRATPVANALLTLLDGFNKVKDNVFVLGATNNLNKIDPAILRSGRFDRRFYLGLPNEKQRLEILKIHTKNRILDEDINLEEIAKLTNEFSGADLSTLINESAFNAITKRDATSISMQDFLVCIKKIRNKISIRLLNQKEKDREIDFKNYKRLIEFAKKINSFDHS